MKKGILIIVLSVAFQLALKAQTWVVPDAVKGNASPFKFTPESVTQGEALFQRNCKSCHGDPGKHNMAALNPPPGDPVSKEFQTQPDGEIFFKMTTGKAPMPPFKDILNEDERWQIVAYLRSFNPTYKQPEPGKGTVARNLKLNLYCDYRSHKLYVVCTELTKDKRLVPVKGADIQLLVHRYFGNMKLAKPVTTDITGLSTFDIPAGIPGNRFGIVGLTAQIKDETGLIGQAETSAMLAIGTPVHTRSLIDTRAMWTVRWEAPVWLILTYLISLLTVWGLIFYILYMVGRVRKV
jgi:mono/diheme cytochrome c family protein